MKDNKEFNQGVIWACARINELHDEPVIAACVLEQARIPDSDFKLACEYDLGFLRDDHRTANIPEGQA